MKQYPQYVCNLELHGCFHIAVEKVFYVLHFPVAGVVQHIFHIINSLNMFNWRADFNDVGILLNFGTKLWQNSLALVICIIFSSTYTLVFR